MKGIGASKEDTRDVYGLGALLYACLTRRPPIEGAGLIEILERTSRVAPEPLRDGIGYNSKALAVLVNEAE